MDSKSVGIYFGADQDITGMSDADLRSEITSFNYLDLEERGGLVEESRIEGVVTYYLNQVLKFRDDIGLGDTIVMPRKASGGHRVAHGVMDGRYEYWGGEAIPIAGAYAGRRRKCRETVSGTSGTFLIAARCSELTVRLPARDCSGDSDPPTDPTLVRASQR